LYEDLLFIFEQFDAGLLQYQAKSVKLGYGKLLIHSYFADLHGNSMQSDPFQFVPDEHQLTQIDRIFYKEFQDLTGDLSIPTRLQVTKYLDWGYVKRNTSAKLYLTGGRENLNQ
jgi:hypothetical protein